MKPNVDLCQRSFNGVLFPEFFPVEDEASRPSLSKCESGAIAELLFDLWCLGVGIPVFEPKTNQGKEDRVIRIGGKLFSVQVKSGRMGNVGKSTAMSLWPGRPYSAANGGPCKAQISDDDADILFCIGLDYNRPSIETSFGHARLWSGSLPQSISFPNGTGWPTLADMLAVLAPKLR